MGVGCLHGEKLLQGAVFTFLDDHEIVPSSYS